MLNVDKGRRHTASEALCEAGYNSFILMSRHRKEGTIRSYARKCTGYQNIAFSKTMFNLASANMAVQGTTMFRTTRSRVHTGLNNQ